ncbi:MAG: hypothetical protein EOO04_10620 [Chitinophagaceae bacterium]|nr:MAG: hypothetical protein EOO04_10620 [Chitinophagaceae bacterium]
MKIIAMTKAAVLFNGIKFPFALIDRAFDWAKKEKGLLLAVFLLSKDADPEGYIFPSDIDAAEDQFNETDSVSDSQKVIDSNIQMLKHRASADGIDFQSIVLYDPSETRLSETLLDFKRIFVTGNVNEVSDGTIESIDLRQWIKNYDGVVEEI